MKLRTVLGVALITLISAAAATAAPKHWHDDNDKHGKKHDEESCYFRQEDVRVGYLDGTVVVYSPQTHVMVDVVALFGR
ncbi:MAG TPA: hypothetical protein VF219_01795 [Vicinamibacterales bacterium]